jgi:hypothetical protein
MFSKILSSIAVVLAAVALYFSIDNRSSELAEDVEQEYPLLQTMGYYQRFSHKIWLAIENKNWELAEFYAHELEEVTEEFIESNVVDEGKNLSTTAAGILMPAIEKLDEAIDQKDEVLAGQNFRALIQSCNACHAINEHAYIRILLPDSVHIFNQDFNVPN